MTVYAAYFSPTGGTEKVVKALMEGFGGNYETIDFLTLGTMDWSRAFRPEDFVVAAIPVYGGRVPVTAARHIANMTGNGAKAVAVAVFGNRAIDDALLELRNLLSAAGFDVRAGIAAVAEHSIFRMYASGRPDAADIEDLHAFAASIKASLDQPGSLQVPGNYPYKPKKPFASPPRADDSCIACMICAEECPEQAIDPENVQDVDTEKCIACLHCVSVCPVGARYIDREFINGRAPKLQETFGPRKPNTLFLPH